MHVVINPPVQREIEHYRGGRAYARADSPGYMTNAVAAMVAIARNSGYRSLSAMVQVVNEKSQRVLERVGFQREGRVVEDNVSFWRFGIEL